MLSRTKRQIRDRALENAVYLVGKDEDPFSICPGCIVDTARVFEAYLVTGENIHHSTEEAYSEE